MKRFRITHRCALDAGAPDMHVTLRAGDESQARERFFEVGDPDDRDWTIVKVEQLREARP